MKFSARLFGLPLILLTPLMASCVGMGTEPSQLDGASGREVTVEEFATGSNAFALNLYREVANDGDNLFFSPASISLAMSFAYRGSDGQTAQQMGEVMRFPSEPEATLRAAGQLDRLMNLSQEGRELRSANAFWVRNDLVLVPGFERDMQNEAAAGLNRTDFRSDPEGSRREINGWVARQTEDRIEELIAQGVIRKTTAAVLVNAIYWKADWLRPFTAEATSQDSFFMADGREIQTDLMSQRATFRAIERGSVKLIELPYVGGEVSMVAILPARSDGLSRLEIGLNARRLERWLDALDETEPRETILTLPKMGLDWNGDLAKVIEDMGAPLPFSSQANFDRMALFPQPTPNEDECGLTISNIIHQANIDVDEKGSEAAAATAVVMGTVVVTSAPVPVRPPFVFRADHPFMFLLRDNRTGAILFLGRLVDPLQAESEGPRPDLSPDPEVRECPPKL